MAETLFGRVDEGKETVATVRNSGITFRKSQIEHCKPLTTKSVRFKTCVSSRNSVVGKSKSESCSSFLTVEQKSTSSSDNSKGIKEKSCQSDTFSLAMDAMQMIDELAGL